MAGETLGANDRGERNLRSDRKSADIEHTSNEFQRMDIARTSSPKKKITMGERIVETIEESTDTPEASESQRIISGEMDPNRPARELAPSPEARSPSATSRRDDGSSEDVEQGMDMEQITDAEN